MNLSFEISPLGDAAVVLQLDDKIHLEAHRKVRAVSRYLEQYPIPGMIEYVPAFTTVAVFYDPMRQSYREIRKILEGIVSRLEELEDVQPRRVIIPVCYGGDFGPDLNFVAEHNGLTPEEVIEIHSSGEYLVFMIGFAPGFAYMGGMSGKIAAPRRSSPRLRIPAGSVGIAGQQTGAYPIETPGGWQLIGRTPLALFRPNDNPPSFLQAGDIVRFFPISSEEYEAWKEENR
jgi:inhibitor of KinA